MCIVWWLVRSLVSWSQRESDCPTGNKPNGYERWRNGKHINWWVWLFLRNWNTCPASCFSIFHIQKAIYTATPQHVLFLANPRNRLLPRVFCLKIENDTTRSSDGWQIEGQVSSCRTFRQGFCPKGLAKCFSQYLRGLQAQAITFTPDTGRENRNLRHGKNFHEMYFFFNEPGWVNTWTSVGWVSRYLMPLNQWTKKSKVWTAIIVHLRLCAYKAYLQWDLGANFLTEYSN